MSRGFLAVGLAVLLIVSMLFVLFPVQAHSTPARVSVAAGTQETPHPAAAVTATIYNGYGNPTLNFYPGEVGWGTLYFTVTDPLDHAVNVTITDPNATRDGVFSPAYHYQATLNTTTSTFNSFTTGVHYSFPANLTYAGSWNVNFSAPSGGYLAVNVSLFLYYVGLSTTAGSSATLPGESIGIFWATQLDSNGITLYTHATNVTLTGSYTGNGTFQSLTPRGGLALTPASAGHGEWTGVVPANTTPNTQLHFQVWAVTNVSGHVVENESAAVNINVGTLTIRAYGITPAPPNCDLVNDIYFPVGSQIASCVEAGAIYGAAFTPISGLPVTVGYWNGTAHVMPSGAPTSLTTNASGEAAFTFVGNLPPFILYTTAPGFDALNFTVTVPGAGTHYQWTAWLNATWALEPASAASGLVQLTLDHSNYYPGDTATASWSVSSTNLTKVGPLTAVGWTVTGPSGIMYEQGILNSTGASGSFTFAVTPAMAPRAIHVDLYVANATQTFVGAASATVLSPSLSLTPASGYYNAGSTTSVSVVLNGGGSGATIQYQVWQYWASTDTLLSNGTVASGGSISIAVASNVPPLEITVDAWATMGGQVIASGFASLALAQGYSILLGVNTQSSYSDGSFQPGQAVTLSYQVVSTGGAALPQVMSFLLIAEGYPYYENIANVGPSGTISFTIPSNAVQGTLIVELEARGALSGGTCFPTGGCFGLTGLYINPSPSALNYELGAGSGVTIGWLILLILVVVIAIVLFFVIRRRGGGRRTKPTPTSSGPTSAPPEEWKGPTPTPEPAPAAPESAASDSSQPPLPPPPQPPAGAT